MKKLRWGIIGAGNIAKAFATAMPHSRTGVMAAVASRTAGKAEKFAAELDIPASYGSYEELLAAGDVDAVYIATPHPMHKEWTVRAAEAGKHVLCEKPLGMNFNEAQVMVEAAIRHDVLLMEAFMYRCNPQTVKLCELLRDKAVGEVQLIQADFSFRAGHNLESRLFDNALGGGGILDVGCYPISMVRLIAGVAQDMPFAEPIEVKGVGQVGEESGCDEWAAATLMFPGGIIAQCATGVRLRTDSGLTIYGTDGKIVVKSPWLCAGREGGSCLIEVTSGKDVREVTVQSGWLYAEEADAVAEGIKRSEAQWPAMSTDDTLGNIKTLDKWRKDVGVSYRADRPEGYEVSPMPVMIMRERRAETMAYGTLPGLDKRISRLVLGTVPYADFPTAAVCDDEFFARGGNCFDTAYVYGADRSRVLGKWINSRDVREDVVVIAKGAHTPKCTPAFMKEELAESLDLLQTDYTDIYFLHRDNPDVPVGEWIDALNEEVDAGRMRVFGGSNWTHERVTAANEYAAANGKQGFAAVSNNFSLARMVNPPWDGCLASSEATYMQWHRQESFPLFSWSSQAQGFFVPGRSAPDKTDDKALVTCWYSDDNFERKARLHELAEKKGTTAIALALRYVLDQSFPVWALIGVANLAEMRTSFAALECSLTPEEIKWLNLEDEK